MRGVLDTYISQSDQLTAEAWAERSVAAQIGQIRTLRQEMQTLQQSLDTDSNGQLSQAELQANPGVVQQIQQKEQQLLLLKQELLLKR